MGLDDAVESLSDAFTFLSAAHNVVVGVDLGCLFLFNQFVECYLADLVRLVTLTPDSHYWHVHQISLFNLLHPLNDIVSRILIRSIVAEDHDVLARVGKLARATVLVLTSQVSHIQVEVLLLVNHLLLVKVEGGRSLLPTVKRIVHELPQQACFAHISVSIEDYVDVGLCCFN